VKQRTSLMDEQSEHDMISALQGAVYRDGTVVTNADVAHMMIAILLAGQHTSSATTSWILLHIAHRRDILWVEAEQPRSRLIMCSDALYEEQKKLLGNSDGTFRPVTYEGTKEMPVLDSVIRETLRIVSPPSFTSAVRANTSASTLPSSETSAILNVIC